MLLTGIEDFRVEFLVAPDEDPDEDDSWEENFVGGVLPVAIRIKIESNEFGTIERLLATSAGNQ